MKIAILHVGKTSDKALRLFIEEFVKRSCRFAQVELKTVESVKGKGRSANEVMKKEGQNILSSVQKDDYIILLDETGKTYDSRGFAENISSHFMHNSKRIVFCIGGAYGFDASIQDRCDRKISLSKMTFNHELALAVFSEQLYRALTILKGHPYHND